MNSVNIPLTLLLFLLPFTTPGVVNSGPFVHSTNGSPNGCPIFQCTTTGSNRISSDRAINVGTSKPQLLWSRTGATFQSLSQNGCVANSINIICGPERVTTNKTIKTINSAKNVTASTVVSSLDRFGNITFQLDVGPSLSDPRNSPSIAIMDSKSNFFWNDAAHIFLGSPSGQILWKNTFEDPLVFGDFYSSTITTGTPDAPYEVIVIAMKNGFMFSYNTEGVPVAGKIRYDGYSRFFFFFFFFFFVFCPFFNCIMFVC